MKLHLLATVSTLALASVASAADLPMAPPMKAPPPAVAPWTWTGFYVGLNGGAAWIRGAFDGIDAIGDTAAASLTKAGGTVGGQIGYNWQLQNFVLGLEGDLNWVGAKGSTTIPTFSPLFTYNTKLTWLATIRGRAGILVTPNTLLYGTGGFAAGHVENDTNLFNGFSDHSDRTGWTAGGGVEYMFARQWTVKAEGLYVNLGTNTVPTNLRFQSNYAASFKNTAAVARIGVNFKF